MNKKCKINYYLSRSPTMDYRGGSDDPQTLINKKGYCQINRLSPIIITFCCFRKLKLLSY